MANTYGIVISAIPFFSSLTLYEKSAQKIGVNLTCVEDQYNLRYILLHVSCFLYKPIYSARQKSCKFFRGPAGGVKDISSEKIRQL